MKNIGRRLFARGAVVGVPTMLGGGRGLPNAAPALGMNLGAGMAIPQPVSDPANFRLLDAMWSAFHKESKAERDAQEIRHVRRSMMGGFDPDLAVLNSMSLGRRVQIQIEREKAWQDRQNDMRHRIWTRLGGKSEDFQ